MYGGRAKLTLRKQPPLVSDRFMRPSPARTVRERSLEYLTKGRDQPPSSDTGQGSRDEGPPLVVRCAR